MHVKIQTLIIKHTYKVFIIVTIVVSPILLKLFVIDFFSIPTPSMKNSINAGEGIIVNKLYYGSRCPESPLDINYFNLLAFVPLFTPWFAETKWPYYRLPGLSHVQRNDVIVFDAPFQFKDKLIKRCIGLPGDTIAILQHQAYVNNKLWAEASTVQLTPAVYTLSSTVQAPKADYGPVVVPKKNQVFPIDTINFRYFQKTIVREGHTAEIKNNTIWIDGQSATCYTFQHDYYFMLGDNRAFSDDSRKWGLVPEENIIGKAVLVVWSKDPQLNKVRWDRLFTVIE